MDENILDLDLTIFGKKDKEKIKEDYNRIINMEIINKEKKLKDVLYQEFMEEVE